MVVENRTQDDSLLPGCCLVLLKRVLSGWWCGPPEGDWWCLCLHSLTGQWSSSTRPAPGVPSPLAAAHTGCGKAALQGREQYCVNQTLQYVQGFKCQASYDVDLFMWIMYEPSVIVLCTVKNIILVSSVLMDGVVCHTRILQILNLHLLRCVQLEAASCALFPSPLLNVVWPL